MRKGHTVSDNAQRTNITKIILTADKTEFSMQSKYAIGE